MNGIENVVKELRAEKQRIDAALFALVGSDTPEPVPAPVKAQSLPMKAPTLVVVAPTHRKVKRHLSVAVKNLISASQKARWAKVKKVNAQNAKAFAVRFTSEAQSSSRRSIAQKARWATVHAAAASILPVNLAALDHGSAIAV